MAKKPQDDSFRRYGTVYFAIDGKGVGSFFVDGSAVSEDGAVRWILAENVANYDRILPPSTDKERLLWFGECKLEAFVTENEVVEDSGLEYSLPDNDSLTFLRRLKPGPIGNLWFATPAELEERDSLSTLVKPFKAGEAKKIERALEKRYPKPREVDNRLEPLQKMCHAVLVREHEFYVQNQPNDNTPTLDDFKSWISDAKSACALLLGQNLPRSTDNAILTLVNYFGSFLYQSYECGTEYDARGTLDELTNHQPSKKAKKIVETIADLDGPDLAAVAKTLFSVESTEIDLAKEALSSFSDDYLTAASAAELLGVNRKTIYRYAEKGDIGRWVDGQHLFTRQEIEAQRDKVQPVGRPKKTQDKG